MSYPHSKLMYWKRLQLENETVIDGSRKDITHRWIDFRQKERTKNKYWRSSLFCWLLTVCEREHINTEYDMKKSTNGCQKESKQKLVASKLNWMDAIASIAKIRTRRHSIIIAKNERVMRKNTAPNFLELKPYFNAVMHHYVVSTAIRRAWMTLLQNQFVLHNCQWRHEEFLTRRDYKFKTTKIDYIPKATFIDRMK